MLISKPQELLQAENLNKEGKVEESLDIVVKLEEKGGFPFEIAIECELLKGILYYRLERYEEAFRTAESVFQESQKREMDLQQIDALLLQCFTFIKSLPLFVMEISNELNVYVTKAERLLKLIIFEDSEELEARESLIDLLKAFSYSVLNDYEKVPIFYENGLRSIENIAKSSRWSFSTPLFLLIIGTYYTWYGQLELANKFISKFEKAENITPLDQLLYCCTKATLLNWLLEVEESIEVGEKGLHLVQQLNRPHEKLHLMITKAYSFRALNKFSETKKIHSEIEELIQKHEKNISPLYILNLKGLIELSRGSVFFGEGDFEKSLKSAFKSLNFFEKFGNKVWIGLSLEFIAFLMKQKGDLDLGLDYGKRCMAIKETPTFTKLLNFIDILGEINEIKGELDLALEYYQQALIISKKNVFKRNRAECLSRIGSIYWLKGDTELALKYNEDALKFSEDWELNSGSISANFGLIRIYIHIGDVNKARNYLKKLENLASTTENKLLKRSSQLAKALILKATRRTRNRAEAEIILKEIIEEKLISQEMIKFALVNLCELYLEELEFSNDPEVLEEIDPLITRLLKIAEEQHSFSLLAETNLLQGRLALIKLNLDNARKFLTKAQNIADEHGLQLLAQKISQEHDKLLEELDTWQNYKRKQVSISKRIKLAEVDGVMDRLLEKRALEPSNLINEEPILLLIMGKDGVTYFNHSFVENWDFTDLFSAFMSAFNTFSGEVFSKSIDRIKIDENVILMKPVESFIICYVIKGQSYPAQQKLTRFSNAIKKNTEIWDVLNRSVKTSEMLDLKKPSSLETVINEIFMGYSSNLG